MQELNITGNVYRGAGASRVYVGPSLHERFRTAISKFGKAFIIAGMGVQAARADLLGSYLSGLHNVHVKYIRDGEHAKDFGTYADLLKDIADAGITRSDVIAYIGGGTVGDLAGFAASTYMRGITLFSVPTTLLSQVDSAIGGKNGINVSGIKNIAGTFYSPESIFCDTDFLKGMDEAVIRDSLSEVIKYAVTLDTEIQNILNRHDSAAGLMESEAENIVARSIAAKNSIVERDPFEREGIREILNAGHTVAHAIEAASLNRISHGRAVLTGLIAEAFISDTITGNESGIQDLVVETADRYSLEYGIPDYVELDSVLDFAVKDKKIEGDSIRFPVMEEPGRVSVRNVALRDLKELIAEWYMKSEKRKN